MASSKKWLFALSGVGVVVVLAGLWVGWQGWQVNQDLRQVADRAEALERAAREGDEVGMDRELDGLREASAAARDHTSGTTWSLLTRVPFVGDDARGVRVLSDVAHDLSEDAVAPLLQVRTDLDALLPRNGRVPLGAVEDMAAPVAAAADALQGAETRLAAEDSSGYVQPLQRRFRDVHATVTGAADAMGSARTAVDVLPGMLGRDGERTYLLAFQNNAEIRATGGMPGALALVRASGGELEILRQTSAGFGRAEESALPLTSAERDLYGKVPGVYFQSSNMLPDFPRVADLWQARWEQEFPEDELDGVLTVDTVTMAYVVGATGALTVDGVRLTGDNLVDELLHRTYRRVADPTAQNAFFATVAATAFDRFSSGVDSPVGLVESLARATDEGRIRVHSSVDAEQEAMAGTAIAGEFVTDPAMPQPQVDVTVNDTTASKMSYFLRHEVDVDATACDADGVQSLVGAMRVSQVPIEDPSNLPESVTGSSGVTEPGGQWVTIRVFAPVGGSLTGLKVNGEPQDEWSLEQGGRPVAMMYVELESGQSVDVTWEMESGPGQTEDVEVAVTPGMERSDLGSVATSAC